MKILITGAAGFIGYHTARSFLKRGDEVIGLDSINDYYSTALKYDRLKNLGIREESIRYGQLSQSETFEGFRFIKLDIADQEAVLRLVAQEKPDTICNLAAQAGVRWSLENPFVYVKSNVEGFLNVLEAARRTSVKHVVYASSSSVYGLNSEMPFSVHQGCNHPVSLYGATKKADELFAHSYSHMFGIPTTGLRFFTVYGPWGRPDMALFIFTKAILKGLPIEVFNNGEMSRDFTYIDDIAGAIVRIADTPAAGDSGWRNESADPGSSSAPYRIYNIGAGRPVRLGDFVSGLEKELGRTAVKKYLPMQPGDIPATWCDVADLERDFGIVPKTELAAGIKAFVKWYRDYYHE
jgi:UDP-glucuronate 4-epimerase